MEITSKSGDMVSNENKSQIYVLEDGKWCEWRVLGGCQKLCELKQRELLAVFWRVGRPMLLKPRTVQGSQWWIHKEGCAGRGGQWAQMPGGRGFANKCELSDLHLSNSKLVKTSQRKRMQSKVRCFNNLTVTLCKTRKAKEHTASLSGDRR